MGDCKTEMKTTKDTTERKKGFFDKLSRSKGTFKVEEIAQTFADHVLITEDKILSLISLKQKDLETEKGREDYNRRALGRLETIAFHVDKIIELANEYNEDK